MVICTWYSDEMTEPNPGTTAPKGDFVCGHRVPWHRLTDTFVACNRRPLKSWVGNSSEGPY
jgi:hypothetical protein